VEVVVKGVLAPQLALLVVLVPLVVPLHRLAQIELQSQVVLEQVPATVDSAAAAIRLEAQLAQALAVLRLHRLGQ
jgi:hypothetical protein